MKEREEQLSAEVAELLQQVEEVDEEENRRHGWDQRGDGLPEEQGFRESRLWKVRESKAALEGEAQAEAEQADAEGKKHPGVPGDKAQRNFTNPDSRTMPCPGERDFQQPYNYQAVVDSAHPGDRGGPSHQPGIGQATGSNHDGRSHLQHGLSA